MEKYPNFQNGKYQLIKVIGQGMTSKVFIIRLTEDNIQLFALKIITNDYWAVGEKKRVHFERDFSSEEAHFSLQHN